MPDRVERPECFISVDVETAGPNPGNYAMLSIGACLVDDPEIGFYVELKPDKAAVAPHALEIGGLSMDSLTASGRDPSEALQEFADWLTATVPAGNAPVFVGFNAPFDWMFVSDYFWRYLGHNPFGHSSLDIKAYYLGVAGSTWARTSLRYLSPLYLDGSKLSHNALADARDQAELFRAIRAEAARRKQI